MTHNDFLFYFVGGTCGSFVKSIFSHYLDIVRGWLPNQILLNTELGYCHHNFPSRQIHHVHWVEQIDPTKQLVVIDFDEDDVPNIIRMMVSKVIRFQIQQDPTVLVDCWGPVFAGKTDLNEIEEIFIKHPDFLIFPEWKTNLALLNPVLVITYKDIMFGDLHMKIAEFFGIPLREEITSFINEYRNCNSKYICKERL